MAGSPIKHERNRLVRDAIMRGLAEGRDPIEYVEELVIAPVRAVLADPDAPHAARLMAANFFADRLDGKPSQQVQLGGDGENPLSVVFETADKGA